MKKWLLVLTALTSFSSFAASIVCSPVIPEETLYNINILKVTEKPGTQLYLIRTDKLMGNVYNTYLAKDADGVWTLNKMLQTGEYAEEMVAQVEMTCVRSN
jgi:hypothetical protein